MICDGDKLNCLNNKFVSVISCKMSNICRTCMSKKAEMISIFKQDKTPSIIDMIMAISSVAFLPYDTLPPNICISCFETLEIAYYFKEQVIRCNNTLQKEAQTSKLLTLQVNVEEEILREENGIFYNEQNECVTIVDLDEQISADTYVVNVTEECNDNLPEKSSSEGIQNVAPHFEEIRIKAEEVEVEEHGVQFEDCFEITPEEIMVKEEAIVDICSDDELPLTRLRVSTRNYKKSQAIQEINENCNNTSTHIEKQAYKIKSGTRNCEVPRKTTKGLQKKLTEESLSNDKPYKCSYCDKLFNLQRTLKYHIYKHTNPHKCEVCEEIFAWPSDLKRHMRTHTNERPFKCEHCNLAFAQAGNLYQHIRLHTGEPTAKRHKCEVCAKYFRSASKLKMHMTSHTRERPHKCLHCNANYKHSADLKRHIQKHTEEEHTESIQIPGGQRR